LNYFRKYLQIARVMEGGMKNYGKKWDVNFTGDKDEGEIGTGRYITFATTGRKRMGRHKYK